MEFKNQTSTLDVDNVKVEIQQENIRSLTDYFKLTPLVPEDNRTNISANKNGKISYYHGQELIENLGEKLEKEATNIYSLGLQFQECDELLTELFDSGLNGTTISALK